MLAFIVSGVSSINNVITHSNQHWIFRAIKTWKTLHAKPVHAEHTEPDKKKGG